MTPEGIKIEISLYAVVTSQFPTVPISIKRTVSYPKNVQPFYETSGIYACEGYMPGSLVMMTL